VELKKKMEKRSTSQPDFINQHPSNHQTRSHKKKEKPIVIFSIDGGGKKGRFVCAILNRIENEIKAITQEEQVYLQDYVD